MGPDRETGQHVITCVACILHDVAAASPQLTTMDEVREHFAKHAEAGHIMPKGMVEEIEEDGWLTPKEQPAKPS